MIMKIANAIEENRFSEPAMEKTSERKSDKRLYKGK